MNELITRSLTGVVFISIVVFATTFEHNLCFYLMGSVVLVQGLIEYKKLKGALNWLFTNHYCCSVFVGDGTDPLMLGWSFIPHYIGWDVVAFLTWIWANDTFAYIRRKGVRKEVY